MKGLLFAILGGCFVLSAVSCCEWKYVYVSGERVTTEDHRRCFQVKDAWKRKSEWQPYCGVVENFDFNEDYRQIYLLRVEKFDPSHDTMKVIKPVASSMSDKRIREIRAKKKNIRED